MIVNSQMDLLSKILFTFPQRRNQSAVDPPWLLISHRIEFQMLSSKPCMREVINILKTNSPSVASWGRWSRHVHFLMPHFDCVGTVSIARSTVFLMTWHNPHEKFQTRIKEMIKWRHDQPSKNKLTSKEVMLFNFTFARAHYKINNSWLKSEEDEGLVCWQFSQTESQCRLELSNV